MEAEKYDFISLGSGEAGKYLAWMLSANLGKKCAVIEREYIGGSCPNIACLPSKNVIHSANAAHDARQAPSYGLGTAFSAAGDELRADMAAVTARKASMIRGLVEMHLGKFKDNQTELVMGNGVFVGPKTIKVDNGRVLTAEHIAICTGSRAYVAADIPGLAEAQPLTHISILDIQQLPSHLVILGGGYVGLEFAQAFRRFGSRVTVVERHSQVLKDEDADVVEALVAVLASEGVEFRTSANVRAVEGVSGQRIVLALDSASIEASHLLVAAGRKPNTGGIGLEEAGVRLTPRGHVQVDEQLRTTAEGVFAVGDCAGSPYFTHMGFSDFRIVYSCIAGQPRPGGTTGRQVPSTLFTAPELAHVGLREKEAAAAGIRYRVSKLPMAAVLRTRTLGPGQTAGFAKALVEADGERILGFTALGPSAGEMLPVVQLAMKLGASYKEIADLIITHPTMCEGLPSLFAAVPPRG